MSNQHKIIAVQLLSQSAIDDKAKEKVSSTISHR
jgi:hypothetical protein